MLKLDEILQLDPRTAITLTPSVRPLWTRLVRYYEEKSLLRHRGLVSRLIAACWTLLLSAMLLGIALVWAAVVTAEINKRSEQQQKQPLWFPYQPAPGLIPR